MMSRLGEIVEQIVLRDHDTDTHICLTSTWLMVQCSRTMLVSGVILLTSQTCQALLLLHCVAFICIARDLR